MKSSIRFFAPLMALVFLLGSCAPVLAPETPTLEPTPVPSTVVAAIELTDGLDRQVTLKAPAQRIISLAPSNTEILYAVGAGTSVVARDDFSNFPAEASTLPAIGGVGGDINLESVTGLHPDLVLASELTPPEQIKALEDLKLTVFMLKNPTDFDGLFANLVTVGKLTGKEQEAAALVEKLRQRLAVVEEKVSKAENRPTVFYELDGTDPAKPWTTGPGTFVNLVIEKSGGQNVAGDLEGTWVQISQEELIVRNPDYILLGDSLFGVTVEQVEARPGWSSLKAVQDRKVLPFNDDLVSRPGPRLIEGLEALSQTLHPELFK